MVSGSIGWSDTGSEDGRRTTRSGELVMPVERDRTEERKESQHDKDKDARFWSTFVVLDIDLTRSLRLEVSTHVSSLALSCCIHWSTIGTCSLGVGTVGSRGKPGRGRGSGSLLGRTCSASWRH